jgi:hypothetical protein
MQTHSTREKKLIVVHQDHIIKFVLFHALENKYAEAVHNPDSIFLMICMPSILDLTVITAAQIIISK